MWLKKRSADKAVPEPEEPKLNTDCPDQCKSKNADSAGEAEDDDDFITNEVKRRLKELRRNSFMVLIPEEDSYPEEGEEEEEEGETGSNEWRDVEAEGQQWWRGFDAVFEKYCERMLFFDRMGTQQLSEVGKVMIGEVEEQIEYLEKLVPNWIYKKLVATGDTVYW
ncbi:hypothetical protein GYH30_033747 [Glycine max]|nr:hypothetical protein GYH30_033747 [Glycine max]